MKKTILILLSGVLLGVGGYWLFQRAQNKGQLAEAKDRVTYAAWKAGKSLKEAADEVKAELGKTGVVVRDKAKSASDAVSAAVSDSAVTAGVKAKLLAESGLRGVGVETAQGVVTLSGTVSSHEDIARAMKIALEADGARRVISHLQVSVEKPASAPK
jgi:hyperosmotically inducible protein